MKVFDIIGSTVSIKPEGLLIPEFKKIWDSDKSKDKKKALNEISYIVFLCDNSDDNPYKNYSETDRTEILNKDFSIVLTGTIKTAIEKFKMLSTTKYERVVMAALDSLADIEGYYHSIKTRDKSEFDINEYLSSMEKLGKSIKSLRELEKQLEADRKEDSKVRGGNQLGDYEL